MQLEVFYHEDGHKTVKKGRWPRTTDDPRESPKALHYYKATGVGEELQLFSTFGRSPRAKQPKPLRFNGVSSSEPFR